MRICAAAVMQLHTYMVQPAVRYNLSVPVPLPQDVTLHFMNSERFCWSFFVCVS
jgi:hypothetical protein